MRVLTAMSGGVDSSVAAMLLCEAGHEVLGATMALWDREDPGKEALPGSACCSLASVEDARAVSWKLGIRHHVFNFRELFEQAVIENFFEQYRTGMTPNPCVRCNSMLKWNALLGKAMELGYEAIATGHYARISRDGQGRIALLKGRDARKDQSYFLWAVKEEALAKTLFPLGDYTKEEVRALARRQGLQVAEKKESQEVCFVPDQDYEKFFIQRAARKGLIFREGKILDKAGKTVGVHKGLPFYTIGQRKGIGHHQSRPQYVTAIDVKENQITIGDNRDLYRACFNAEQLNWLGFTPCEGEPLRCRIKIRYRQEEKPGQIMVSGDCAQVRFDEPQRAVAPGQSAAFYEGERLLGGGIITGVEVESSAKGKEKARDPS